MPSSTVSLPRISLLALPRHIVRRAGLDASPAATTAPELTPVLLWTMAVTCAAAVANLYYNQPLLAQTARSLGVGAGQVAILPTVAQLGFAAGVFFLAPLGDVVERRRLILGMVGLLILSLVSAALAPNLAVLTAANLAIGVTSVISTLVMPFAVSLSSPHERGKTVGTIASAMLLGILLSRSFSGVVGGIYGWRVMYWIATGLMVLLGVVLAKQMPATRPSETMRYGELLRSMLKLAQSEPQLRAATINGMLLYGALSAFWASLIFFLESPAYHQGPAAAGLFGLIGAASALAAPAMGRLSDRRGPKLLVGVMILALLLGYAELWLCGTNVWGLILGVAIIDVAAQSATISNQAAIYGLAPGAHSRLYTVYRSAYSIGGAAGAYLGLYGWSVAGWNGVCGVAVGMLLLALGLHVAGRK